MAPRSGPRRLVVYSRRSLVEFSEHFPLTIQLTRVFGSASDGCIIGQSTISAGIVLELSSGNSSSNISSIGLLSGDFDNSLPTISSNDSTSANSSSSILTPFFDSVSEVNTTGFTSRPTGGKSLSVSLDLDDEQLLAYSSPFYSGSSTILQQSSKNQKARSFLISDKTFVVVDFDPSNSKSEAVVLYAGVADTSQWSLSLDSDGKIDIQTIQSTTCTTPCSSHGVCASDGSCKCDKGFTGKTCSKYLPLCTQIWTDQVRRQVLAPVAILGHFVRPAIVQRKRPVVRVSQAQVYAPPTGTSLLLKVMLYCYWEHKADTEQS